MTRILHIGEQEIGTLDDKGKLTSLRIPGIEGGEPSLKSIAIELEGKVYAPLHDLSGNIIALLDPQSREVVESYSYSAFGEETLYNVHGEVIEHSQVGNPWRFAEKRKDPETNLIFFGFRVYDPSAGRWISPDPLGHADGPNLYAYVHNNPLKYRDRFGLASEDSLRDYFYGEVEPHCFCERHRLCKRGGNLHETDHHLPKITYDDDFDAKYALEGPPEVFDLGRPELANGWICYVPGIDNTIETATETAEYLSDLAGGYNVHVAHNPTCGWIGDGGKCKKGLYDYVATETVRKIHEMWNAFFAQASEDAMILVTCHSGGAIHVRNALLDYPPELRKRILVVAIAPGGYIYKETCARVLHYRVDVHRDLVPYFDWKGAKREKDTIVTLISHRKAPFHDHTITSPTYKNWLKLALKNYIESGRKSI